MRTALIVGALFLPAAAIAQQTTLASRRAPAVPPTDAAASAVVPRVATATSAVAVRAERAPVIDGRDDDPVWRQAMRITDFQVYDPTEGGKPAFPTEAMIAYDARNLYVFVRMFDPHPDSIVARLSRRDVQTSSDQIIVLIDSYHDRRTDYEFGVNPAGVKIDLYGFKDGEEDASWDAVWDVATHIDSLGWTAEYRIPLSQLRFTPQPSNTFGVAFARTIGRTSERDSWPLYHKSRAGLASQFGTLTGLAGLESPRRLELTPYALTKNVQLQSSAAGGRVDYGRQQQVTGGADLKYGVTSNLTLDATINPDFGQVEADPSVLNLTALETFFPEKRPFFLEGTGIFRFDINCSDGVCNGLFNSRRIGRTPQLGTGATGEPAVTTILGASKLTGRLASGTSVGVLDAVTAREQAPGGQTIEPETNYGVVRLTQDFRDGKSGVGVMLTGVDRALDRWTRDSLTAQAYAGGVDFRHRFAHDGDYQVDGYVAASHLAGTTGAIVRAQTSSRHYFQRPDGALRVDSTATTMDGGSAQLLLEKIGGGITRFSFGVQGVSPGFEINDLGFLPRADSRSQFGWVGLQFHTPTRFYRSLQVNFNQWQNWTWNGMRTDAGGNINWHAQLPSQWWLHFGIGANGVLPSYCDRCAFGGRAIRQSPSMNMWYGFEGDMRKPVAPSLMIMTNRGDGGRSHSWEADPSIDFRVASRFSMSLGGAWSHNINDSQFWGDDSAGNALFAHLDQTTVAAVTRINYTATPDLSLQVYAMPFVSSGHYTDLRRLADPRAASYDARFAPASGSAAGGDFNVKDFNANTVLRWEYLPGSTLFVVWSEERADPNGLDAGTFAMQRDFRTLFTSHPRNTFLVKVAYWFDM